MHSFKELSQLFETHFDRSHFPATPSSLYYPAEYILALRGKRVRPVICLMGNELVNDIDPDAYHVATAIELFHNFTLIHDDIMDKAPIRRGHPTVHNRFGESTALLAGDAMLVVAYDYLNKIRPENLHKVLKVFNLMARQVCEGQQLDMDFEKAEEVSFDQYLEMITLKTSVLLAASLKLGALLGGSGEGNQHHIYEFGKHLGIAFQVQDDYLDAYGDPEKFGKQKGGDILANKKTFLAIRALEVASPAAKKELQRLFSGNEDGKVDQVMQIFRETNVEAWSKDLKDEYLRMALGHLEDIAVLSARKKPLEDLAHFLIQRQS